MSDIPDIPTRQYVPDHGWTEPDSDVRLVPRGAPLPEPAPRSKAETYRTGILDEAEDLLRRGRDLIVEGLDLFGVLDRPQHPNLETLLGQALEQVIEYRRLHP